MNVLSQLFLAASPGPKSADVEPPGPATPLEHAAEGVLFVVVDIGIIILTAAFVMCLWRLVRGPSLADRGLATDTLAMQVVGLVILLTIRLRTLMFFDAVLIVSILGFAGTVAFAQFIARRGAV